MTIESIVDQDLAMQYVSWALEMGLWDGREIDPNRLNDFKDTLIQNIVLKLFSEDSESYPFRKMSAELAYLGALEGEDEDILEELASLQELQNGIVIPAGFCKSLKKFWKKHKVEILIGIAAVAVVTAVAVSVFCAAGVAGGVLATGEEKDKKEPPKPETPGPVPEAIQESCKTPAWPKIDLVLKTDEVRFNGQSFSYGDALQAKTIAQTIYAEGESKDFWKMYRQFSQDSSIFSSKGGFSVPDLSEERKSWIDSRTIPVFSSKNYPPVTDRFAWVCKMIDWGFTENEWGVNPSIPTLENATSQVFRTEGEQRKSLKIIGINGINTSLHESIHHAEHIARFTNGLSVTWIHNHSNGALVDVAECVALNFSGVSPYTKNLIRDEWIAFHELNKDNPKAKCLHYCHSQGAIATKNALESLPEEIRQRVIVVAIAPAAIIPRELCYESYNYASKLDKVYLAEIACKSLYDIDLGRQALEDLDQLILLDPHEGATGLDHDCESPTFVTKMEYHSQDYLRLQGIN